jgi:hypothetical protein
MQVTLQVKINAARKLHKRQYNTRGTKDIADTATHLGVSLEPMHPGTDDPNLVRYFTVQVPDAGTAEQVIKHLQKCKAVEAVYLKPPEAMP